ncbi:MAG: adenylate cyclase, partial [Treponemataceae bacterium]|nr:adenylate cyclase [Treponemataceae bacterium]
LYTWIKHGRPDVSMSLNASLAGLVAITAGCATTDALGSLVIGIVSGFLVVFVVEFLDCKLHIDDPVGAVAVHLANGIWGTLACGLFNVDSGLFYGHGFHQLGIQALGIACILAWPAVCMLITFTVINKAHGLRVTPEEEILGLDKLEHGIDSSYAGFVSQFSAGEVAEAKVAGVEIPVSQAVPVTTVVREGAPEDAVFSKIVIVTRQTKFDALKAALNGIGVTGMTVVNVMGCGMQKGASEYYRGVPLEITLLPKIKVEIVVSKVPVRTVIETAKKVLYTGHIGDGKIFVYKVDNVVKIRTGEEGYDALQNDDE